MEHIDDYRNNDHIQALVRAIRKEAVHPWQIMEICGGQTHTIVRYRMEEMLPSTIKLLHGPGCPVCVTPETLIDQALEIAQRPEVIFASFGDMMRVSGSRINLLQAKARGADIRMLYSPLDAVELASVHPEKEIVFFAIGFETTAPVHLMALQEAKRRRLKNFSLLCSLFAVPPAIEMILRQANNPVDGFLAAGHVCAVTGYEAYHRLAGRYRRPIVVTGFEPADILYGIYQCIRQLEKGEAKVENAYKRAVLESGNPAARQLMEEMLEPADCEWRGIGLIPASGFSLREKYGDYDAGKKFPHKETGRKAKIDLQCIAGEIMKGKKQTIDCPHFGTTCKPNHPLGAPMVSAEGVCAAYYTI
jgi:hydrogenase expression/formation protein HypD